MKRLQNKVALITGGARGMGASHVKRFVAEGAKVYFTDVLQEEGENLQREIGAQAVFMKQDVSSESDWKAVIEAIDKAEGKLDLLVNNAGIAFYKPYTETTLQDYQKFVNVNQVSVFLGQLHALPLLKKSGNASIVNISSGAGLKGQVGLAAYASTKFAVRGLTQVAALEFGHFNIRVNSVHPGSIRTPALQATGVDFDKMYSNLPIPRVGEPEELTNIVLFLASDEASYVTGGEFVVDGGLLAGTVPQQ